MLAYLERNNSFGHQKPGLNGGLENPHSQVCINGKGGDLTICAWMYVEKVPTAAADAYTINAWKLLTGNRIKLVRITRYATPYLGLVCDILKACLIQRILPWSILQFYPEMRFYIWCPLQQKLNIFICVSINLHVLK